MDSRIEVWRREERHPFVGWDFSHLDGRMIEGQPPWSYTTRVGELMRASASVLDIDTGGGERLLGLREHWPTRVVATEAHPPNVEVARTRLEPVGCSVVDVPWNRTPMPFADGEFDLILSRHSPFQADEVARMLSPGGTFLTQQVHWMWAHDLLAVFGAQPPWPETTLEGTLAAIEAAGLLIVTAEEWTGELAFTDVGAVVYYLKAVPWLVPGFSVESHVAGLIELQRRLDAGDRLAFGARKFLVEARKPPVAPGAAFQARSTAADEGHRQALDARPRVGTGGDPVRRPSFGSGSLDGSLVNRLPADSSVRLGFGTRPGPRTR